MSYFYSHLIEIESIIIKLDEMGLSEDHKKHLAHLLDSTIHQTVLDLILSKLPEQEKLIFLGKIKENPADKNLMDFINTKVENIEDEIKEAAKKLKEELDEDIKRAKKGGDI